VSTADESDIADIGFAPIETCYAERTHKPKLLEISSQMTSETMEEVSDQTSSGQMGSEGADQERSIHEIMAALPEIKPCDFVVEQIVGEGAFSDVLEVRFKSEAKERAFQEPFPAISSCSFALKCSKRNDIMSTEMMNEAAILSKLDHANIIKAIGVSRLPPMLLLELLECTLEDRLKFWRDEKKTFALFRQRRFSTESFNSRSAFSIRTEATVKGIAYGLAYLHSKNIILRDLKPENIGYTSNGEVKLFDFGFACQVEDTECQNIAGSLRYTRPPGQISDDDSTSCLGLQHDVVGDSFEEDEEGEEGQVLQSKTNKEPKYGFSTDVHSFGVVLWEIATLKIFSSSQIRRNPKWAPISALLKKVSHQGWRPTTQKIPNANFRFLVKECWNSCPDARPSLSNVCDSWLPKIYPSSSPTTESTSTTCDTPSKTFNRRNYTLPKFIIRRFQRSISFKAEAKNKTRESGSRRPSFTIENTSFSSCSLLIHHAPSQRSNHFTVIS
jgi:serine/threonine protein kinase